MMDREDWNEMLDECLRDDSDTMTEWEIAFIDSLDKQRQRNPPGWEPSENQWKCLTKIWEMVFG